MTMKNTNSLEIVNLGYNSYNIRGFMGTFVIYYFIIGIASLGYQREGHLIRTCIHYFLDGRNNCYFKFSVFGS